MSDTFVEITGEQNRIEAFDPVMRHQRQLHADRTVSPEQVDPSSFVFPVQVAARVEVGELTVDNNGIALFDERGKRLETLIEGGDRQTFEPGVYHADLMSDQMLLYLRFTAEEPFEVALDDNWTGGRIRFETTTAVDIGTRSRHERPAATVTTTSEPEDLMRAVSTFGSALKTTDALQSFPSLRGHPPALELGDSVEIPSEINTPETGIRIELPRRRELVYAVAPLAYYLGADVVPGETPRIVTNSGHVEPLESPLGTPWELERVLRQVFFFDCLARADIEYYTHDTLDRAAFESEAGYDLSGLADRPLAERMVEYLDIPFGAVEPHLPRWHCGASLAPTPENARYLPYLTDTLTIVKPAPAQPQTVESEALEAQPDRTGQSAAARADNRFVRSASEQLDTETFVMPSSMDVERHLWVADGIPVGGEKPTLEAYRRARHREPVDSLEYVVVCNDDRMAAEDEHVRSLLSKSVGLPFSITAYRDLTTDELQSVIEDEGQFFHFIGHTEKQGLVCPDGYLDAHCIEETAADAFFLNACRSYEQGSALLAAGAVTGIVTLADVFNSHTTQVGINTAKLVNEGIPVGGALSTAVGTTDAPDQYAVLGDGNFQVVSANSPIVERVDRVDGETIYLQTLPATTPYVGGVVSGGHGAVVSGSRYSIPFDLQTFLDSTDQDSIVFDGELRTTAELGPDDF